MPNSSSIQETGRAVGSEQYSDRGNGGTLGSWVCSQVEMHYESSTEPLPRGTAGKNERLPEGTLLPRQGMREGLGSSSSYSLSYRGVSSLFL